MELNNPAIRLHDVLNKSIEVGSANVKARDVWAVALSVSNDDVEITSALIKLYRQLENVVFLVRENHKHPERMLKDFERLRRGVSPANINEYWHQVSPNFEAGVMARLESCGIFLDDFIQEKLLSQEEVDAIVFKVEELENSIQGLQSKELRLLILKRLREVKSAVLNQKLSGYEDLTNFVSASIGDLYVHHEVVASEIERNTQSKDIVKKYTETINEVATTLTLFEKTRSLGVQAVNLLTSLTN
nr:hypothetical protein [uncultured Deefgea sp.]